MLRRKKKKKKKVMEYQKLLALSRTEDCRRSELRFMKQVHLLPILCTHFLFMRVGRHTYLGNVGMSRLGWRRSLMEEILNYGIFFLLRCSLRHKFSYDQARPQQLPSLACSVSSLAAHPQLTLLCYWRNSMPLCLSS
ncbi:hypothetical protein C1H46_004023 [Malus baccata]|uniref:Uncharacterized protein n=1 Tax=Malus baccata TaxID=106549 RepID=A0A540NHC0_MALBA|nr:hypothetical protein C1H46_004023 [Malus baccata]